MEKKDLPKQNKPVRENLNKNELPYDPNITREDKQALQERGLNMNPTDDKFLADRDRPVDFTAEELDIPGRNEVDTPHRGTNIPDEENFQYDESGVKKKAFNEDTIPDEEA